MAGKIVADTLQNGTGATFNLAANIGQLARVKTYQVTDGSDISLSGIPTHTAVGSPFAATIPTKGNIVIDIDSVAYSTASGGYLHLGVRIGTTNYWPLFVYAGTTYYPGIGYGNPTFRSYGQAYLTSAGGGLGSMVTMGIESIGLPTGAQTLQLIAAGQGGASYSIKGATTAITRVNLRIFDHS